MEVEEAEDVGTSPRVRRVTTGGIRVRSRTAALDAAIDAIPRGDNIARFAPTVERVPVPRTPEPQPQSREDLDARPPLRERVITYLDYPQEASRTPSPEPGTRALPSFPPTPVRPSTPPAQMTPLFAPSPPPSVTPRLYSWSTLTAPTSPIPASPLTNRNARMSVAHIVTPTLIPAHRAA